MEHYWLDLPGPVWFSGADIYRRYVESVTGPSTAVELGAWKGRSTCFMGVEIANSGKPISFYTVDHWRGSAGEADYDSDLDLASGRLFKIFLKNIEAVAPHVNVIRSDSAAAAAHFADESVDFLYIDASHTYEGVLRDLLAWFPKVKNGGTIAGDDWCFSAAGEKTIRNAVVDYFGAAAAQIRVEDGSEPNCEWLQWSVVKSPGLQIPSPARLALRRLQRAVLRSLPVRLHRSAIRRMFQAKS
jgi:predicted O-methyltransferase YrrM